jgi:multiple sugar transport system permease protein/raffinose/stachyose/melibiose transport system permease protein
MSTITREDVDVDVVVGPNATRDIEPIANAPRRRKTRAFHALHVGSGWVIVLIFALPLYIALAGAFKTNRQTLDNPLSLPIPFTFDNIVRAVTRPDNLVEVGLMNSIVLTACTILLIIPLASALSFYIIERRPRTRAVLLAIFALGLMVPGQVGIIPVFKLLKFIHLDHTYPGLLLFFLGSGFLSFAVFLYAGFLRTVPREIIEAARVDGASDLRIWWSIMLPVVRPVTATVAIFIGLWVWNDFLNPLLLIGPLQGQTITTGLYIGLSGYTKDFAQTYAMTLIASAIPVIAFLFLQKEFIAGLLSGASKS